MIYKCCGCGKLFQEEEIIQREVCTHDGGWGRNFVENEFLSPCCEEYVHEFEPDCTTCKNAEWTEDGSECECKLGIEKKECTEYEVEK